MTVQYRFLRPILDQFSKLPKVLGKKDSHVYQKCKIVDVMVDEIDGSAVVRATEELSFHLEAANKSY